MNLIVLECWITFSCDPDTSVRVGIDLVLNKLSSSLKIVEKRVDK